MAHFNWDDQGVAPAWAATTGVSDTPPDVVLGDDDVVWYCSVAGVTGAARPDFAGEFGAGFVVDGSATWVPVTPWADTIEILAGDTVQPTVANQHWYVADGPGTTRSYEPTWPTDGGSVVDGQEDVTLYGSIILDVYRIVPPGDTELFISTLEAAFAKRVRIEKNGTGWGEFSISSKDASDAAAALVMGNLIRVSVPEIQEGYLGAFFLEEGDFDLVSTDEEGGEDLHFKGSGPLSYMGRAVWVTETFLAPWWPGFMADPPADAIGAAIVNGPTWFRTYSVSGGTATYDGQEHTNDFSAYYDTRASYRIGNRSITLVHLITGVYAGLYIDPTAANTNESRKRAVYVRGESVLMSGIATASKPGEVLYAMCQEALSADRRAHPVPLLSIDFTATQDSDGNFWTATDALQGITAELGDTYLDTIGKLIGTGVIDVVMDPNFALHAYNHYGRDLTGATFGTGVVRFEKGVNIADELTRQLNPEPVATWAEIIGSDERAATAELPDAADRITREIGVRGDSNDPAVLAALGLAELNRRLVQSDQASFAVDPLGSDPDAGLYLPGPPESDKDFWVGDLVRLHTGTTNKDFNEADVEVSAILLSEDDAGALVVVPELGGNLDATSGGSSIPAAPLNSDCGCPCDLGTNVAIPETEVPPPPVYLGEYNKVPLGTGTGSPATYTLPWGVTFVEGSLSAMSLPTGLFLVTSSEDPDAGTFVATAPSGDDVYAMFRAGCELVVA